MRQTELDAAALSATPAPATADQASVRLTEFSHGGGCGCKIAPGVLQEILAHNAPGIIPPELLVGTETSDDAAVYQLNETQALVATTDFFMPIVDDPYDFGRIAATNALSDVYAMGGRPILALALVGMPVNKLPLATIRRILEGGASVCRAAQIPLAGGHTIDSVEPIYGLVALGLVDPKEVKKNSRAQAGDQLILGKPLGVGIYSAALKRNRLDAQAYAAMIASTTQLNTPGQRFAALPQVHALTDVTGFGLLGHLLEICRGSQLAAKIEWNRVPLLPEAVALAGEGIATGASARNWASYGPLVTLAPGLDPAAQTLLTDPQTSGGLLVACAPTAADEVRAIFSAAGFEAAQIGELRAGEARIRVDP